VTSGSGKIDVASAVKNAQWVGPQANNPTSGQVAVYGMSSNVGSSSTGITNGLTPATGGMIALGSFNVVGITSDTHISLGDATAAFGPGNTLTFASGFDLDQSGSSQGAPVNFSAATGSQFTLSASAAVPEPSSMLLCGLVTLGGAYSAYRRR